MTFRACRDMAQHYGEVAEDFPIVSISEMNSHYGRVCDVIDGATQVEHVRERLRNAFFLSPTQYGYISVDTLRKNYMDEVFRIEGCDFERTVRYIFDVTQMMSRWIRVRATARYTPAKPKKVHRLYSPAPKSMR